MCSKAHLDYTGKVKYTWISGSIWAAGIGDTFKSRMIFILVSYLAIDHKLTTAIYTRYICPNL